MAPASVDWEKRLIFAAMLALSCVGWFFLEQAHAQVAFDAASSSSVTNAARLTFSHTVSRSNHLLIVGVTNRSGSNRTVSSVTYAGTALTSAGGAGTSTSTTRVEICRLAAPATGSNNVVVTMSWTQTSIEWAIGAVSIKPVPPKTRDGGAGTNNWGDVNNWNSDGVPTSMDDIGLTGANTIDVNVAGVCNDLTLIVVKG